jgi:hypothetical protein
MPSYKQIIERFEKEKVKVVDLKNRRNKVVNTKESVVVTKELKKEQVPEKLKIVISEKQPLDARVEKIKNSVQKLRKPRENDRKIVELW